MSFVDNVQNSALSPGMAKFMGLIYTLAKSGISLRPSSRKLLTDLRQSYFFFSILAALFFFDTFVWF